MPFESSISMTTRIADLDSLRHVNNRIEEHLLVSLSQTRPKAMPADMKKILAPCLEFED